MTYIQLLFCLSMLLTASLYSQDSLFWQNPLMQIHFLLNKWLLHFNKFLFTEKCGNLLEITYRGLTFEKIINST